MKKNALVARIGGTLPASLLLSLLMLAVSMLSLPLAAHAQSLLSETDARQVIEERYGVEVLRIEKAENDGLPVFIMRVMNAAGDFNEAFQVNVLVMNRRNGELVPQFHHGASGATYPGDGPREVTDDSGPALRKGTFR